MFCPNCGSSLPDNAEFCGKCGTRISKTKPAVFPAGDQQRREGRSALRGKEKTSASDGLLIALLALSVMLAASEGILFSALRNLRTAARRFPGSLFASPVLLTACLLLVAIWTAAALMSNRGAQRFTVRICGLAAVIGGVLCVLEGLLLPVLAPVIPAVWDSRMKTALPALSEVLQPVGLALCVLGLLLLALCSVWRRIRQRDGGRASRADDGKRVTASESAERRGEDEE